MKRAAIVKDTPEIAKPAIKTAEIGFDGDIKSFCAAEALNDSKECSALTDAKRLAAYERMHKQLCEKQEELSEKLEQLRSEGKKNTVKFRELMGEKLINTSILSIYKAYGL